MPLEPKKVGPLTIGRQVGEDGVATLHEGTFDVDAERPVLVRRLKPWLVRDATLLAAVEARVGDLRRLQHPRLVRVLGYEVEGDAHDVIEAGAPGTDLATLLGRMRERGVSMPPPVFLHLALQLATSVEALHNRDGEVSGDEYLLHRALRPAAITLTPEGSIRLGGYGLLLNPNHVPTFARRGSVAERTAFLAPEQVEDGRPTTLATDIFSLGSVYYTMLTGEVLFDAATDLQAVFAIREADVEPALGGTRSLLPGIERILGRCLSAKPRFRYQAVHVLRSDLRNLADVADSAHITDQVQDFLASLGAAASGATTRPTPIRTPPHKRLYVHDLYLP